MLENLGDIIWSQAADVRLCRNAWEAVKIANWSEGAALTADYRQER